MFNPLPLHMGFRQVPCNPDSSKRIVSTPTIRTITPTILPLIYVLDLFFIRNGQRAPFPTAVDCRAAERGRLRREGCERPYFCKPCQNEWIRNWFKVPWFGDYSLPCERSAAERCGHGPSTSFETQGNGGLLLLRVRRGVGRVSQY